MCKWCLILVLAFALSEAFGQNLFDEVSYEPGTFEIPEARGVAVGDFDNDGDEDFFISAETSELYRNEGNFQFTRVTIEAGMSGTRARTAVWTDIDNDGWLDLVSSSWQDARIFINNGDGTFRAGKDLSLKKRNLIMAGDLNGDGWVDLFSSNFKNPSELLINDGSGDFIDLGESGNVNVNENGMGGLLIDIDEDGDLDIYVSYDGDQPGRLFINDGEGVFADQADAYGLNLEAQAMGVDMGDVNNDGRPDFYVTNLGENFLFIAQSDGTYQEVAESSMVADIGMGWGVRMADFDNDGRTDIYINNEYEYSPFENRLYMNQGSLAFSDVAAGTGLDNFESGYGTTSADFDNDGFLDVLIVNDTQDRAVRLFRNRGLAGNHWFQCNLLGTATNNFALGARVEVYYNGEVKIDQVTAGSGWASQQGNRLHFGLGNWPSLDSLVIFWPDGSKERYNTLSVDQRVLFVQGEGQRDISQYATTYGQPGSLPFPSITRSFLPDESHTAARQWNELLLTAVRSDFARPTVHARNLFHLSIAMYDAWAAYGGNTFILGKRFAGWDFEFEGVDVPEDVEAAREKAISYAAYRLLNHRFAQSPGAQFVLPLMQDLMERQGYDWRYSGTNYQSGEPAALGNFIADHIIDLGYLDGANERNDYANSYYEPVNTPLRPQEPGDGGMQNPDRWQPLEFDVFIDQSGNVSSSIPDFLGAEWGNVVPFALPGVEKDVFSRGGQSYSVFLDPGAPPQMTDTQGLDDLYKWHHTMVSVWGSHLDYRDGVMIDVSPNSMGNNPEVDASQAGIEAFYDYFEGGDASQGYELNPVTGQPYDEQIVPRGDFARVLAEFWADGPDSETPPGHWFTILNYVHDHPLFERRLQGEGVPLDELEWDVKAYLMMGGAMHDAAVAAWSVKGYYDYVRPISAIRYMVMRGQSSDPSLPNYDSEGIPLIDGYVELIEPGDPLAGSNNEYVNEIKLYTWRGHDNYNNDFIAGVGWILGQDWISYQRATFVTPPFAGYVSGHSTFSRTAADVLTFLTGSEYFPGGMGEFVARQNDFLVFERGPSVDVRLQWAKYRDAADQSALSRIWGGIHPPADDLPGRLIGKRVAEYAVAKAMRIFDGEQVTSVDSDVFVDNSSLYPNPAVSGGQVYLGGQAGAGVIRILDFSGKLIQVQRYDDMGKSSIILPELNPGLYLVEVVGAGDRVVHKLIIR